MVPGILIHIEIALDNTPIQAQSKSKYGDLVRKCKKLETKRKLLGLMSGNPRRSSKNNRNLDLCSFWNGNIFVEMHKSPRATIDC